MKSLTRNETADFLRRHDNYAILTHRRPDGDTLGSAAALCLCLRKLGKTAHILRNPDITDRFRWLHEGLTKEAAQENDCIVTVDVATPSLLPEKFEPYLGKIALRIDHHGSVNAFTAYEMVDSRAAACAEIIYDIAMELGMELDADMANGLYVGTSTDTGCFRFANTNSHSFSVAAACAAASDRIYALNQELFETNTLGKLRMQSWIVDHMKIFGNGDLSLVVIPRAVEESIGVTEDDMNNISSFPRSIAGIAMAATLRETKEGTVKASIRAIPGRDATQIAAQFGGGGHKGAAGATMQMPLAEAAKAMEASMLEYNP